LTRESGGFLLPFYGIAIIAIQTKIFAKYYICNLYNSTYLNILAYFGLKGNPNQAISHCYDALSRPELFQNWQESNLQVDFSENSAKITVLAF
jgi:hypothetical protein